MGHGDISKTDQGTKGKPRYALQEQIELYREQQRHSKLEKLEGLKSRGHSRHHSMYQSTNLGEQSNHTDLLSHLLRQDEKIIDYTQLPKQFNLAES